MALLIKLGFAKLSLNTRGALTANDDSGFLVGVLDYKRGIFGDDGDLLALRYGKYKYKYKYHFMIQENETGLAIWQKPFTKLRVPKIFDLSIDPFERGDTGMGYDTWMYERSFLMMPAIEKVQEVMGTFKAYPPRMAPGSFVPK